MADEETLATGEPTPQAEEASQTAAAAQSGEGRMYTQAEVDRMMAGLHTQDEVNRLVGDARKKVRSQFEGYDRYKADAEAHADYDEVVAARDKALSELESMGALLAHRDLVDKVSAATGIPAALLKGDTEEELTASAEAVAAYAKSSRRPEYPQDKGASEMPAPITKEEIKAEKDTRKRQALIAENLSLFDR